MKTAIRLPDLGVKNEAIRVSCWLVDIGDDVEAGDRVVEVQISRVTFDVASPGRGIVAAIERSFGDSAKTSGRTFKRVMYPTSPKFMGLYLCLYIFQ